MPIDLVLVNANVCTSKGLAKAGLAIDDGRIIKIAKETNLPEASARFNLKGCLVLPGLVDTHVHLRDQQLAYKEDFTSGTTAAAAGGITTVVDMPNNRPVTMSVQTLRERMQVAEKRILVNVAFNSTFPNKLDEIPDIVDEGAIGFKLYLLQQIGGVNIDDDNALQKSFETVAQSNEPICVHAEDKTTLEIVQENMRDKRQNDAEAFSEAHPTSAEAKAIQRTTMLARNSGAHVHVCHISSEEGLNTVLKAKEERLAFSCEVTPHHLLLTSNAVKDCGSFALMLPPLRDKKDVHALWKALGKGLIDTLASDHAPHSLEEKTASSIWDVKPGIAGLETMLPLMLNEVYRGRLTIHQLVQLTASKPAEIFRLKNRGSLSEGCFADLAVIDLKRMHKIDASKFYSKAKFSPFDGWKIKGKPMKTFVNGVLVMDEGEIVAKPETGHIIRG